MTKQKKKYNKEKTRQNEYKSEMKRKTREEKWSMQKTAIRITHQRKCDIEKNERQTNDQRTAVGGVNFSANVIFNHTWFCCSAPFSFS